MGRHERRGSRESDDEEEDERTPDERAFEILKNYVESEHWPESLSARKMVALLKVTRLFPETMKKRDYVRILAGMLPYLGYSDTIFKRREFRKTPSKQYH